MQLVPLQPTPSQTLQVLLNQQLVRLNVRQQLYGLFVDVLVDESLVVGGVLAHNLCRIVRYAYLGFAGDFTFADAQGTEDPNFAGLGGRFELLYLSPADLKTLGLS